MRYFQLGIGDGTARSTRSRRATTILVAIVIASVPLTGCTFSPILPDPDSQGTPTPSSSASESPAPEPSGSPSPSPSEPPRLPEFGELVIAPEGLGSLLHGEPVTTTDMVTWDPDACLEMEYYPPGDPRNGRWIANYGSTDLRPFDTWVDEDGIIGLIGIRSEDLRTATGIHIGSTVEELRTAYPDLVDVTSSEFSTLHAIETAEGIVSFEVIIPGDYWPEFNDRVFDIRIMPTDATPVTVAATDNSVGGCL